jgi:hypothetical protein
MRLNKKVSAKEEVCGWVCLCCVLFFGVARINGEIGSEFYLLFKHL